ncbi:MAG: hypothetical protein GVY35_04310 [Bacteroidetes bacterium]|jgi:inward rectifier potassium channel|nr:hypothetical protein [Bacteroidota bacterium]
MGSARDIFRPYVQDLRRTVGTEWKEADDPPNDLGFGSKVADQARIRLLNRDGTFNVEREGLSFFKSLNLYHTLLSMSWWSFTLTAFAVYVVVNLGFAMAFVLCGADALAGSTATTGAGRLAEAFFFSVQTFTSVGYGALSPEGLLANGVATVDAFAGLLFFALVAGLVFARFAQPQPQIAFSEQAVIAPYRDHAALEFRIANQRQGQLIEVEAKVVLRLTLHQGDVRRARFYQLPLERDKVSFFPLHWTVVHPIDEASPLHGFTDEDLRATEAEILIQLTAIDETSSQGVHTRSSYRYDEIVTGAQFQGLLERAPDGGVRIDLHQLDDIEAATLPDRHDEGA